MVTEMNVCFPTTTSQRAENNCVRKHWANKHWAKNNWVGSNLHRNPFGELSRSERAELAVVDVQQIVPLISQNQMAVQFVGGCGRGKTTRLLKLADRFPEASYTYLAEDQGCPPIPWGRPVLIDEAQRLPLRVRRMLFLSGLPLVLATHRDLSAPLRRFGYQVHTQWIGADNTPELICQVLNRRIESSRLSGGPIPVVSLELARRLFDRFGTDLRGIEGYLYEQVQSQVDHHGKVRFDN